MKFPSIIKNKMEPSSDLYKILGVGKNASFKTIKEAFKKKAKIYHPDHGGKEEDFTKLLLAYTILYDPEKRRIYDETGEIENTPNNDFSEMVEALAGLFESVLNAGIAEKLNINIINAMLGAITRTLDEAAEQEKKIKNDLRNLKDLLERIRKKSEGANIFSNILNKKIEGKKRALNALVHKVKIIRMAEEELKEYDCITEVVDIVKYYSFLSPLTSTTS